MTAKKEFISGDLIFIESAFEVDSCQRYSKLIKSKFLHVIAFVDTYTREDHVSNYPLGLVPVALLLQADNDD